MTTLKLDVHTQCWSDFHNLLIYSISAKYGQAYRKVRKTVYFHAHRQKATTTGGLKLWGIWCKILHSSNLETPYFSLKNLFFFFHCLFYDKKTTPIDFQGQRSRSELDVVKLWKHYTDWIVLIKTVKLLHILLMTRKWHLLLFKVSDQTLKGQGHTLVFIVNPRKRTTDWTVSARTVKLGNHDSYDKRMIIDTYWFSRSGVKDLGHKIHIVVKPCKHHTDWTISARTSNLVHILLMTR